MCIGVLTGGGDVPGLSSCIKAVVSRANDNGWDVTGIRGDWAGLLNFNADDDVPQDHWAGPIGPEDVRTIDRTGGTAPHTSRTNPDRVAPAELPEALKGGNGAIAQGETYDCTPHIMRTIEAFGIDALRSSAGNYER